jgi:hypothetical protein
MMRSSRNTLRNRRILLLPDIISLITQIICTAPDIERYCIAGRAHWICPSCFGLSIIREFNEGWREGSGTTLVRQPIARATPEPKSVTVTAATFNDA